MSQTGPVDLCEPIVMSERGRMRIARGSDSFGQLAAGFVLVFFGYGPVSVDGSRIPSRRIQIT